MFFWTEAFFAEQWSNQSVLYAISIMSWVHSVPRTIMSYFSQGSFKPKGASHVRKTKRFPHTGLEMVRFKENQIQETVF